MDIIKRLRSPINEEDYFIFQWPSTHDAVRFDAAAEIERLRDALRKITDDNGYTECCGGGTTGDQFNPPECCGDPVWAFDRCVKIARTALAGEKTDD